MDEFLDDMDDEQVDDLLMPEEDETSSSQMLSLIHISEPTRP